MKVATFRAAATALTACGLVLASLAPASARSDSVRDKGDFKGAYDIQTVKANHTKKSVVTKIDVRKLRKGPSNTVLVGIQSRPRSDYGVVVLVRARTKARLYKEVDGKSVWIRCKSLRVRAKFGPDRVTTRVPRKCLNKPGKVRVRAKAGNLNKKLDGTGYTRWLARG